MKDHSPALPSLPETSSGTPVTPVWKRPDGYRNLFREIGLSEAEIEARINRALTDFFHGDESLRCYYPVGEDEAYIYDSGNDLVCSEGMSYGMMIAVQAGRREEFDRLWNYASRRMRRATGDWAGCFAWRLHPDGSIQDPASAPDGEEYIAMALFFAWRRWRESAYKAAADDILLHLLHQDRFARPGSGVKRFFDPATHQVVFVPYYDSARFTDPSYHLPAFYELWSRWADAENESWKRAADASRVLLARAAHPKTGLCPDYCGFDGAPCDPSGNGHEHFRHDACRVIQNLALDCDWFGGTQAELVVIERQHGFFSNEGLDNYANGYSLDGAVRLSEHRSAGIIAMNAVGSLVSRHPAAVDFVRALWEAEPVRGKWRYYDGCLYLLGLLIAGGRYRIIGFMGD